MQTQKAVEVCSSSGWSCPPSPPSSNASGWADFPPTHFPSDADLHFSSPKVQAWAVGNTLQLMVVKEVKSFFNAQKDESDDDHHDDHDYETEDSDSEDQEGGLSGVYAGFFLKLFQQNDQLRGFYEKNHEDGEFGCLVCGGVGFIRRFKDCVALVQHTVSISKTKKMKAHRAFGQVVCKVLGWDIDKLPSSVGENKNVVSSKAKEIRGDGSSIAAKLKENALDTEQGSIEGALDCLEGSPDNGTKCVGRDVDVSSVNENDAAETKGKEATGTEMFPTTDISNLAQSLQSVSGIGRNPNYLLKETPDEKQENAESSSNCVGPHKEVCSGKNESEDK